MRSRLHEMATRFDVWVYRTLGRNWVLRVAAFVMLCAGAVRHVYEAPMDPWPLKVSKLALYVGTALGISAGGIAPAAVKPDVGEHGRVEGAETPPGAA